MPVGCGYVLVKPVQIISEHRSSPMKTFAIGAVGLVFTGSSSGERQSVGCDDGSGNDAANEWLKRARSSSSTYPGHRYDTRLDQHCSRQRLRYVMFHNDRRYPLAVGLQCLMASPSIFDPTVAVAKAWSSGPSRQERPLWRFAGLHRFLLCPKGLGYWDACRRYEGVTRLYDH